MKLALDGKTVLLTGASSGIGLEMARRLAPRVGALGLVARRQDKLEALRDELRALNAALSVVVLPCDLSELGETARLLERVERELGEVNVLINNAGVGDFAIYDHADWERTRRMVTLNVESLLLLTRRLVPAMVARGAGGVLNVSSVYGVAITPAFAAYSGSKHFVTAFTEALRMDLTGTGVVVSQLLPGPVRSEFADRVGYGEGGDITPSWAYQSAATCAQAALRGFQRGRARIVPGVIAKILYFSSVWSPRFLQRLVMAPFGRIARRRLTGPAGGPGRVLPGA
jgi:short-subunit dehydrogenase